MSFTDFQNMVNDARANSEGVRVDLKTARNKTSNIKRQKDQVLREIAIKDRPNSERLAEINHAEREFAEAVSAGKTNYKNALQEEWANLNEHLQFTNPIENLSSLQDDWPILLFPLRLETRFKKVEHEGEAADQLWVRVYPDDIVINSFESDLSETEIRNIQSYWLARWKVGKDDVNGNRGAWRSLASAHGPGRAYWLTNKYIPVNIDDEPTRDTDELILAIGTTTELFDTELDAIVLYWQEVWLANKDNEALIQAWDELLTQVSEERATTLVKEYKPTNIADPPPSGVIREDTTVRVEFVIFETTDELETKLHAWSQPPTTNILPERFVFLAYHDDELDIEQLGNLVPPNLILGPDPAAEEGEDFRLATQEDADADPEFLEGDLIFNENMKWMFDFEEAIAKGMGFKINLNPEQAKRGFDRVFVLGVKLSADNKTGQTLLEELFEQHQNSRKGLAIIKQGTPTNNTEDDESGYSWKHDPDDSFDIYFGEDAKDDPEGWYEKRDGRWLAELLGINPEKFRSVENYYSTDICEAKAMQQALWPATMGHFMDSMMNPVFIPETIEQTREFFTRYVTGRGNLPAIRVGKQPYGILPATNYTNMGWLLRPPSHSHAFFTAGGVFQPGNNFLLNLYRILLDMDKTWTKDLLGDVAYVGKDGDPHQLLLDIVGLHPNSVELYKRYANSLKQIHNSYNILSFEHGRLFKYFPTSYAAGAALLAKYGYIINEENTEPDIFKKSFFENSYFLGGDRIDKVPNSEEAAIEDYVEGPEEKNYITWLLEAAVDSHDRLRKQDGFIEDKPPTALLYLLLYHSLDLSYIDTSLKLHLKHGVMTPNQVQHAYLEPDFIHIEEDNETESRWKFLYKADARITDDPDIMLGNYIPLHLDTLDEAAAFRDVLAGLRKLENVPTARLERTLMEHIDTVSYRYDAWILGYLNYQLEHMRGLHLSDSGTTSDSESETSTAPVTGVYIGAYGWLEDLRPENKELTPKELSGDLKDIFNPDDDLVEDDKNGGYILAPSQNHAVTAAVLRNGHLSNDDPEDKEELKIKLSSERVRLALQIIEGIQGGQTLSALLGYQFERGLHDRTDVEVDEFIFELRNAFPLVAKKFKDTAPAAEDTEYESIEQIEAKNVLDGIAFLEHIEESGVATYPFALDLPVASDKQETAMNEEVLKLIEINDAVADLALAESVHQVVLGNYERAAATLETYSKGNFPPTPDVIQTPRSGTTLTHRVALQFKTGLSHALGDSNVTPRMVTEPAIHDWLSHIMPAMSDIVCVVSYVDRLSGTDTEQQISIDDIGTEHPDLIGLQHIDLLYLMSIESDQAMSALDDLIIHHVLNSYTPRMEEVISVAYTRKLDDSKFTVFEVTSLIASLRAILLKSKSLAAEDVKLPNEASKENKQNLELNPARISDITNALGDLRTNALADYITDLTDVIATDDVTNIVNALDTLINNISLLFIRASNFGMPQTGIGFVYQWQQGMYTQLRDKMNELIDRWQNRRDECQTLLDEYTDGVTELSDEALFSILIKAEFKIATTTTSMSYTETEHATYFSDINDTLLPAFVDLLDNSITPVRDLHGLTLLFQGIQNLIGLISPFDIIGIDIEEQLHQVQIFADDLLIGAENLSQEIQKRETKANDFLASAASAGDELTCIELRKNAAKAIFGDDFVLVPEFTPDTMQGTEWTNALAESDASLRYLTSDLDMDFPMDDWLYGVSRVREKLYHIENTLVHIEGFTHVEQKLVPTQFPYRENDYWLGLQFPESMPNPEVPGEEIPFSIHEDKLLYTAIYPDGPINPTQAQCGLLLDEWTEVIPSHDETPGLTFHYDQPNSEPPQTLLLATPSNFSGTWHWQDLVNTLHETLDMAKKRAVEPDHVDTTVYSRFLPPIVSLASPLPLTASLNLALNNKVFIAKVFDNE